MKNFDWTSFTRKITVKASLAEMYSAWACSHEIERWFLSRCSFKDSNGKVRSATENFQKGDSYDWNWHLYDVTESGKITEANGKDFLQFSFASKCLVDVKLSQKDEEILVELTQKDIPTDDDSKKNIRLGCDSGWSFFLLNLKSVYEGGLDLREKKERISGMINC